MLRIRAVILIALGLLIAVVGTDLSEWHSGYRAYDVHALSQLPLAGNARAKMQGIRDGFVPEQARDAVTTTPTTLAAWAFEELRPTLAPR